MNFYQEVTLIRQPEISLYFIWSKVYTQLHIALVESKNSDNQVSLGVAFPEYRLNSDKKISYLGSKLRVFSQTEAELVALDLSRWLERLTDYVHISPIRSVPKQVNGYAIYKRKQVKSNAERLARHRIKRGDITYEEALQRYLNITTHCDLPFIQMHSLSGSDFTHKQQFKLFIEKIPATEIGKEGFNAYGLSQNTAVPEF
ncbi:type I-F CRISPR-associated endoribonuclease Cas6/Csy4 [Pseudomonas sp. F1_0610]|uniref:type I-F CRISPR-associated endoribonuclease Cas6/Csy4 n=1 Tax=Pseudomonas sp. F1_0610 TaxID=3114284 RepID=UPI0039C4315D